MNILVSCTSGTPTEDSNCLVIKRPLLHSILYMFMGFTLLVTALLAAFADIPYATNYWLMRIGVGYIGTVAAMGIIGINLYKIIVKKISIKIDEKGILDYSNVMSSGFTPWDNLKEVYLLVLPKDEYLCAVPRDMSVWMDGLTRKQKRLAQANIDMGFPPIRIQFKAVSDKISSREGVAFVKSIQPKLVSHVRKIKINRHKVN